MKRAKPRLLWGDNTNTFMMKRTTLTAQVTLIYMHQIRKIMANHGLLMMMYCILISHHLLRNGQWQFSCTCSVYSVLYISGPIMCHTPHHNQLPVWTAGCCWRAKPPHLSVNVHWCEVVFTFLTNYAFSFGWHIWFTVWLITSRTAFSFQNAKNCFLNNCTYAQYSD